MPPNLAVEPVVGRVPPVVAGLAETGAGRLGCNVFGPAASGALAGCPVRLIPVSVDILLGAGFTPTVGSRFLANSPFELALDTVDFMGSFAGGNLLLSGFARVEVFLVAATVLADGLTLTGLKDVLEAAGLVIAVAVVPVVFALVASLDVVPVAVGRVEVVAGLEDTGAGRLGCTVFVLAAGTLLDVSGLSVAVGLAETTAVFPTRLIPVSVVVGDTLLLVVVLGAGFTPTVVAGFLA